MSPRGIDPARSRIILVGASKYKDAQLKDIPQIANNLRDLASVLTDPSLGGFPQDCVITLPPHAGMNEIGRKLHRAADEAEDLLLFYFAGHGLLPDSSLKLHLALHATESDIAEYTALSFDIVRRTFQDRPARNRVVVLDSCFSGSATGTTLGSNDQDIVGQLDIAGTYILTSSPSYEVSRVFETESHTVFTGRLLALLREGIPSSNQFLSMQDIYHNLHRQLKAENLPLPQRTGTANAEGLGLVRNRRPHTTPVTDVDDGATSVVPQQQGHHFQDTSQLHQTRVQYFTKRAEGFQEEGDYTQAIIEYTNALKIAPGDGYILRERGNANRLSGNYEEALTDLASAISTNENDVWSFIYRGQCYRALGDHLEAWGELAKALRIEPENAWALTQLGWVHQESALTIQDCTRAIDSFSKACDLSPGDHFIRYSRGRSIVLAKNWDLDGSYHRSASYHVAISDLTFFLKKYPADASARSLRGEAYRLQRQYTEAINDFSRCLEIDPSDNYSLISRGQAHRQAGNFSHAIKDFKQAMEVAPSDFIRSQIGKARLRIRRGE